MRLRGMMIVFILIFLSWSIAFSAETKKKVITPPPLAPYDGKTFTQSQDPEFKSYELALRNYLIKRINKQFGVALDPKIYTGYELLEIEAFLKCKKSNEQVNTFLRLFPK